MDDLALLELLECPVCFEKLDASAKVLPCQHTFCKPCLQRILKSQKELRCPECRTLVLGSIEQLPSNLLLIRLLDGVRCGQKVARFGSMQRSGVLSSPASLRRVPRGLQLQQQRLANSARILADGVPRARALYTFRGHNPGELRFNKGDTIALLRRLDEHWYLGELRGSSGVFPASSVQVIQPLPLPPGSPAQLLQATKGHWSPQPKGSALAAASPKGKGGSGRFPKECEPRRKSLRQFSITTALNTLNRMVHAPAERPALRISSPVLISSSNPSVPTAGSDRPCGTPSGSDRAGGTPAQVSSSYPSAGALGPPAAIVPLPQLQQQGPAHLKSSLSDSKMPSLYTSWTLSSSSLSSQGSAAEPARQSQALLLPLPVPVPVPSAGRAPNPAPNPAPAPLRRGRGSSRKNGSLQRPGPAGTLLQVTGSLRRPAGRPQPLQPLPPGPAPPAAAADRPAGPSGSSEAAAALLLRAGGSRAPSVCSSLILEHNEPPGSSEAAPKPPASAPPSILVKPETSRNSAEKQVKTVRFQTHSPPPPKRHSLQPSPRLARSRTEPGPEALLAEPRLGPELLLLCSPRLGSSPLHPRRALHPKALSLDLSGQLTFPIKKSYSSISAT
ncbi:E3 ubiquitin-protein ligase SH3RF2 [Oenanthe melanoleuca]|uniref:E3 ubiquitin-protein ligase SH3RF2 n=1 Tax=Oenanthe melanoleuca TaxID=2939378 RepID=UPI0024C1F8CE|nr:E3 ubiquitin-protein ligase SH3RF2 [Oenanthe melanoleuca]